jgi:heterodisulfide reductase subunit A
VNYGDSLAQEKIEVGSIILAPGYEVFDAHRRPEFGYGVYPNVVTSIEFERLLSATGPHRGHLLHRMEPSRNRSLSFSVSVPG